MRNFCLFPSRILFLAILLFGNLAFGVTMYGEGEPGPHGGQVRMPGEFHVEVLPLDSGKFKAYLLNLQNQEPVTLASSIKGTVKQNGDAIRFMCEFVTITLHVLFPKGRT